MRRHRATPLLLAGLAALVAAAPCAAQVNVSLPWVRATAQRSAPVYMQFEAHAAGPVALVGASSPLAKAVKIVAPGAGGTRLEVAAGSTVLLRPGGPRLLLSGLARPLARGAHVPLTLNFEVAGTGALAVDISAEVVGPHDMSAIDHEKRHRH